MHNKYSEQVFKEIRELTAASSNPPTKKRIDEICGKLLKIAHEFNLKSDGLVCIQNLLPEISNEIDVLFCSNNDLNKSAIITGFNALDELTGGMQRGDLVVVAGDSCLDKTLFSINLAHNVAKSTDTPVAIFSMRISARELTTRLISVISSITLNQLKTGRLIDNDWENLTGALGNLNETSIFIDETQELTFDDVYNKVEWIQRNHGKLNLIVIDGLDLFSEMKVNPVQLKATMQLTIQSFKNLAVEFDVPVVLVSKLNFSFDKVKDKLQFLQRLDEALTIKRFADTMLVIHREEFNCPFCINNVTAQLTVAKNNRGPLGTIQLKFNKDSEAFSSD